MHAIVLGIGSDIGCEFASRLHADSEWHVTGYHHGDSISLHPEPWDLLVCCYGTMEPIGSFWEQHYEDWERAFYVNLFLPLTQIKALYQHRRPGASVCLFSGAGTSGQAPTYSAYSASKVALVKMTELMDDESPDCKFFILGPGIVRTKLHQQTLDAERQAANYQRVVDFMDSDDNGTSHDDIYACLMACRAAPKAAVGGRNICVHLDDWSGLGELAAEGGDEDMFKLRRFGDEALRRVR